MLVRQRSVPLTPAADCLLMHLRRSAMSRKRRGVRAL
jgi:hypothetical protein